MNATYARDISEDIRRKYRGRMVHFAQRVQPDFEVRLEATAKRLKVQPADVLRALGELYLDQAPDPVPDSSIE